MEEAACDGKVLGWKKVAFSVAGKTLKGEREPSLKANGGLQLHSTNSIYITG